MTPVDILVAHQRRDSGSCICGWSALGASHAAHQVDELGAAGYDVIDKNDGELREYVVAYAQQCDEEDRHDTDPPSWWQVADKLWTILEVEKERAPSEGH